MQKQVAIIYVVFDLVCSWTLVEKVVTKGGFLLVNGAHIQMNDGVVNEVVCVAPGDVCH